MIELVDAYSATGAVNFLYELLGERKVSESISHKRYPSYSEHKAFFDSKPYLGWYLIADDHPQHQVEYIGTCYITKYREVGIWLMPSAKGKGAGKAAMRQLLAMYPGRVFTNTAIYNDGAKAFYEKIGFRHCANMLEHDNAGIPDIAAKVSTVIDEINDARRSDSTGKVEQHAVTEKGLDGNWRDARPGLDVTSGKDCQEC